MLRIPVTASRLTAVADASLAEDVASAVPEASVRVVTTGVTDPLPAGHVPARVPAHRVTIAVAEPSHREAVHRAVARLSAEGMAMQLAQEGAVSEADVVVAVRWPLSGRPLVAALRAMAAGQPLIVAETPGTAAWPAWDPQTWRPRDLGRPPEPPAVVSVDPRDEEHSLVLAIRRLAADASLRTELGTAARAWWATHATLEHAVATWLAVVSDAAALPAPRRPDGWPRHLDADGSALARQILAECGVERVPGY